MLLHRCIPTTITKLFTPLIEILPKIPSSCTPSLPIMNTSQKILIESCTPHNMLALTLSPFKSRNQIPLSDFSFYTMGLNGVLLITDTS